MRNPPSSTTPARPPGTDSRSTTTTSWPRPARWHAADRPPRPAPTTTVRTRGFRLAVAPGDERTELLERDTCFWGDRRDGERFEGLFDEPLDAALDLVDGASVDEHGLQSGDLGVIQVGPTQVLEPACGRPGRARRSSCYEQCELALARLVSDRLAGDSGIAEDAEDVVAQLEGLTERQPEGAERIGELVEATRQRRAQMQGPFDRVLPGLVPLDPGRLHRVAAAAGCALEVEVLADAELDPQLVEDGPRDLGRRTEKDVGVHEGEVADEDRRTLAVAAGLAPPPLDVVARHETAVDRRETST